LKNKRKKGNFLKNFTCLSYLLISLTIIGLVLIIISYFISDKETESIILSIGTGIFTSSLVSLFIDISNKHIIDSNNKIYFDIIFEPLFMSTKNLYLNFIYKINEYRLKQNYKSEYLLLPTKNMQEFVNFFIEIEKQIDNTENIQKEDLSNLFNTNFFYYNSFFTCINSIAFENLYMNQIIDKELYNVFTYISSYANTCENDLLKIEFLKLTNQEEFKTKLKIMKLTLIILSKLINNFDTFEKEIYSINITVKNYCDELSNHYYEKSEDYIKNEISRNNDLAEFYEQNTDKIPMIEKDISSHLSEINDIIWKFDTDKILKLFDHIDSKDKDVKDLFDFPEVYLILKDDKKFKQAYKKKYGMDYTYK